MPRQNVIQSNFSAGEVSPKINGRVDTKLYANGAKRIENFIVLPQGGVTRRGGSGLVNKCKFSSSASRLFEFEFSDTSAFTMELGVGYIRFHQNGLPVFSTVEGGGASRDLVLSDNGGLMQVRTDDPLTDLNSLDIQSITVLVGVGFRVYTAIPHTFRTGQLVRIYDTTCATLNGLDRSVTYYSPLAFDIIMSPGLDVTQPSPAGSVKSHGLMAGDRVGFNGTGSGLQLALMQGYHFVKSVESYNQITLANVPYSASGSFTNELMYSIPIEIESPYTVGQLQEIRIIQSADTLYLLHPDVAPRKLIRYGSTGYYYDWSLSAVSFVDGPYLPLQDDAPALNSSTPAYGTLQPDVYLELSSYAHTATVTAAANFAGGAGDQNKYLEAREGDQWRLYKLTSASSGVATGTVDVIENVLLHLDETTKFKNTIKVRGPLGSKGKFTYDAGSPNASPSIPAAGVRRRIDPNNHISSGATTGAGTLTSNYSNTFGVADVGKYVRFFDATATAAAAGPIPRWAQIYRVGGTTSAFHGAAVAMVSNRATGDFVISGHSRTGTVSAKKAGVGFALFNAGDVGRHIRMGWAGRWTWGIITAVAGDLKSCTVSFQEDVPRDPHNAANLAGYSMTGALTYDGTDGKGVTGTTSGRTYDWRLGAWSATTGYPSTGCFHEQRLMLGRTDTQPQSFWGSVTGDFENFAPTELDSTVLDDNGLGFTLASGKVNAIKWMESGINLVIGTNGGEWLARSTSAAQEPITPTNITVTQQGRSGSSRTALPLRVGSSIVFVNRSEQKVMDVSYLFSEDRLQDKDLTVASEHVIRQGGTVVQCAYQQNPHMIAWFVLSDGTLAALTYNQEQEIIAWHRHEIAGADVESIAIVPNEDGTEDDVYLLVKRTVSAADYRTVELLAPQFYSSTTTPSSRLNMRFMDGYVAGTNNHGTTSLTSITGLNHLEGKTVIATVNGTKSGTTFTVSSGAITVTVAAGQEYCVGMAYTPIVDSLPPEGGSAFGTSQGMKKRVVEMKVRSYDTCEFDVYPVADTSSAKKATYNESTSTQQFFTGTTPVSPKFNTDIESAWRITTSNPYALTVLAVVLVLETTE